MEGKTGGGEGEGRVPEVSFRLELDGRNVGIGGGGGGGAGRSLISPSGSPVGGAGGMQKCLSFPRIVTDRPTSWSISPCQSRTYLDACYPQSFLGGSEKSMDPDRLSIAGHAGLLRSMSARTVELEGRNQEPESVNSSGSSSRYLSPACDRNHRMDTLAARSTSCPSMAYTENTTGRGGALPPGTAGDMRQLLFRHNDRDDPDLAGEEIDDLPIEPNTIFPELPTDLIDSCRPDTTGLSLRGLRINDAENDLNAAQISPEVPAKTSTCPPPDEVDGGGASKRDAEKTHQQTSSASAHAPTSGGGSSKKKAEGSFVNVRDLPRSSISDAMKQRHVGLTSSGQNMDTNQKCLRWLNTLPAQRS